MDQEFKGDEDDSFWWKALADGECRLAICESCAFSWMKPVPTCPGCGSDKVSQIASEYKGTIYSWVTVRRQLGEDAAKPIPYTVVMVTLDEGARVYGRLVEGVLPAAGMPVAGNARGGEGLPFVEFEFNGPHDPRGSPEAEASSG